MSLACGNRYVKLGDFFLFLAVVLASCATMQEDVYVENLSENSELSVFEMRFIEIDSAYFDSDEKLGDKRLSKNAEILP